MVGEPFEDGNDDTYPNDPELGAILFYTSGSTGKPKGVLHTHRSIESMARILTKAWKWTKDDQILHTLPVHHVHGVVNALHCCLYIGATCHFLVQNQFHGARVWDSFV